MQVGLALRGSQQRTAGLTCGVASPAQHIPLCVRQEAAAQQLCVQLGLQRGWWKSKGSGAGGMSSRGGAQTGTAGATAVSVHL